MDFPAPRGEFKTTFHEYTSDLATLATNFSSVELDLEEALLALAIFGEVTSEVSEGARVTSFALWTYAITMYSRVFAKGGPRPWIDDPLDRVFRAYPTALQCHEHIMQVRNKHIAHPTSDLERIKSAVELGIASDGRFRSKAVGLTISTGGPAGTGIADDFRFLVQLLLSEVRIETVKAWDEVSAEVKRKYHSSNQILKLPIAKSLPLPGPAAWRRPRRGWPKKREK
jgi:hypothetical protein